MADNLFALDRYIARSMETVQGYLTRLDARLIAALLSFQDANNIVGHLGEIGVHHGRLYLMLALARRVGERALAIDLFEDDAINANTCQAGRDRALFANARRLGIELSEEETFKTSSLAIEAADILVRTTGPIRFWSIDGGHLYHHVENDLLLAKRTLAPEGVVAVDDFFNPGWADVSFAVYDFLRRSEVIFPFAITAGKIYLAPSGVVEKYKAVLQAHADAARTERVQVLGKDVLLVRQRPLAKGYDLVRNAIAGRALRLAGSTFSPAASWRRSRIRP